MSLVKHIHAAILARALSLVGTLPTTFEPPVRTEQDLALDTFFATSPSPFGGNQDAIVSLVGIITGYKPAAPAKITAEPFTIVYCRTNARPWIVLSGVYGFSTLAGSIYHIDAGCERVATQDEGDAFLEQFSALDPEKFMKWLKTEFKEQGAQWIIDL